MDYNPSMTKLIITAEFDSWLSRVRDRQAAMAIVGRLSRARLGNLGHWRAVGDGISEMKIDVGKGYRVYFKQRGDVLVIILCGGDKSTQAADIKRAKVIAKDLEF
ncbi:type II toxin-antitoxin system RelE/ParE family toxin [Paraburkholderia madseniana]|jgi:putative addiction module killer protein|uniref:Type II toxin-antitoxin system RelE/ParE family toxin n=2 Tax=Burkholderiaceae TaxID=119060 RepID=A0A6N6W4S6_9BURK|nr:type II toxin-antitoxin system RelE/ParE family toxin [Paraburkholderia madseniana]NPT64632.1 type II toxin-antitoxin system RelE/ParE family toxin [Paraburkholderia madseniana]